MPEVPAAPCGGAEGHSRSSHSPRLSRLRAAQGRLAGPALPTLTRDTAQHSGQQCPLAVPCSQAFTEDHGAQSLALRIDTGLQLALDEAPAPAPPGGTGSGERHKNCFVRSSTALADTCG